MAHSRGESLAFLEDELRRSDPEFVRAFHAGRPCRPREYRNRPAWGVLVLGVGAFACGAVFSEGLLLAGGLVAVGVAAHLLDPARVRTRYRERSAGSPSRCAGRRGGGSSSE